MSKSGAQTLALVTGATLIGLALLSSKTSLVQGSTYKRAWAAGLAALLLFIAADLAPEFAGPFALLVLIAAVVKNPGVVGDLVNQGAPKGGSNG